MIAIARLKKPHRLFAAGDLVIGEIRDGCADNLVCSAWSSKLRRVVSEFRLRYCDHVYPPKWAVTAWRNCNYDATSYPPFYLNGNGHLRIIKWFEDKEIEEVPPQLRDESWLRRQLVQLSCGNMPLSRAEAIPSNRTF